VILTDIFAADFFIEILRGLETDFFELDNLTVCALGEAVSDRLRFIQVHADVIPSDLRDESVFQAISQFVGGHLADLKILAVTEESRKNPFIEMLSAKRASVEILPLYKMSFPDATPNIKLKTLLKGGAIDELVFSTAEDFQALKFLFGEEKIPEILSDTQISATSEIVFQTLQENGFRPLYFHHK